MSTTCDICGGPTTRHLPFRGILRENRLEVEAFSGKWIWRCEACNHSSCHPKPEAALLDRYYQVDFWAQPNRAWLTRIKGALRRAIPVWRLSGREPRATLQFECIRPFLQKRGADWLAAVTAVEIGAGNAAFTRLLRRVYKQSVLHVVEPGEQFTGIYRAQKIKRVARRFEDVTPGGYYKLVHCSHWLEHIADVRLVFDKYSTMLTDDGLLFIEVPNCDQPYWSYRYYPDPPHLQFFTPQSLALLAESGGFRVLYLGTGGQPMELDKNVGYLRPDSPELISADERVSLLQERERAFERVGAVSSDGNFPAEAKHEFIRIVLEKKQHNQS